MTKNKHFKQLNKIIKSGKSHAGFTLIELLSGLIMSTIVVAGLGFGLYQLTKTTRDESAKIEARIESIRVREFVADELRRAQSIEVDNSIGAFGNLVDTVELDGVAQDYTLPNNTINGIPRLALQIPGVTQRVIYTVAEPDENSTWEGPLVLYRWGPNMNANGEYNDPLNTDEWDNEPLVDGLDNSPQPIPDCNGVISYTGFFACMEDDDGDGVLEDGNTDWDNDGDLTDNDDDDIDGLAITAQLYFTSGIDIINGNNSIHTAETQVVARARDIDPSAAEDDETIPLSFRTLAAEYSLGPIGGGASCNDGNGAQSSWFMRTDFINDPNLGSDTSYSPKTWIHDPDRQAQPININTNYKLMITSVPIGYDSCTGTILSRGNETLDDTSTTHEKLGPSYTWTPAAGVESSDFTIDFSADNGTDANGDPIIKGDPNTFNGNKEGYPDYDNPNIPGVDHVKVYKKGSPLAYYDGYDDDTTIDDGEQSLGEFLASKGYAVPDGTTPDGRTAYRLVNDTDYAADPTLNILADNERIIAVEIGQALVGETLPDGTDNPGFDLQDSVFILSTDKFAAEYPDSTF